MNPEQALQFMSQLLDDMCGQLPRAAAFSTQQMGRQALGAIEKEIRAKSEKESGEDKPGTRKTNGRQKEARQ